MSLIIPNPIIHADPGLLARHKIDQDIAALEARIIELKTLRNTYTPIARLHPEIMQEIFVVVSQLREPYSDTGGNASLLITWVCHSWRELAHLTPAVWSYIHYLSPQRIEAALSRTRGHQLEFGFYHRTFSMLPDYDYISACLQRLSRVISFSYSNRDPNEEVLAQPNILWANPAPQLVHLTLSKVSLPPNLFSGIFPALRSFMLFNCEFDWESLPIHAGIQELRIARPSPGTSPENVVHILRTIGNEVRNLDLSGTVSSPNSSFGHSDTTRTNLPNLRSFRIHESANSLVHILPQFTLPSQGNITVYITMVGATDTIESARSMATCCSLQNRALTDLEIEIYERGLLVTLRKEDLDVNYLEGNQTRIIFQLTNTPGVSGNIVPILHTIGVPQIKSLALEGDFYQFDGTPLIDYFSNQRNPSSLNVSTLLIPLFTMVIHNQNLQVQDILGGDVEEEDGVTDEMKAQLRSVIGLQRLTTLCYDGTFCEEEIQHDRQYFDALFKWLRWRRLAGIGLKRLVFTEISVPLHGAFRVLFSNVVEVVVYDRVDELDTGRLIVFSGN